MSDGARAFIQKPYVPAEVLRIVRTVIDEKE
jgi:FixJ family two-component response regulator